MKTSLTWLGHAAFSVVHHHTHILIDPFLTQNPSTPQHWKSPDKVDVILLTHGHEDHVGDAIELATQHQAKVVGIVELIAVLKEFGLPSHLAQEMNKGGTLHFDTFSLTMTSANHSSSYKGRYCGEPAGYILHLNQGPRLYHCGDTNIFSDMALYATLYAPDICMIPIGDHYTMGVKEAVLATTLIKAKHYIPIHYGTWPILHGNADTFKKNVEEMGSALVHIPQPGEPLQF